MTQVNKELQKTPVTLVPNPRTSTVLISLGLAGSLLSACTGSKFESCDASRTCTPLAGDSSSNGAGGEAGSPGSGGSLSTVSSNSGGGGSTSSASTSSGNANGSDGSNTSTSGGGSAGEASENDTSSAGAGGAMDASECETDADCADASFCNGAESCLDGVCAPGGDPCAKHETAGCSVECDEDGDVCLISAADQDSDGYGSAACSQAPGLDCDDELASIAPGAPELCDGLDNDCDELIDLADGLPLGGTTQVLPIGADADLAWSPVDQVFGVAYIDVMAAGSNGALSLGKLGADGSVEDPRTVFGPTVNTSYRDPSIAWSSAGFGVVLTVQGNVRRFGMVSADLAIFTPLSATSSVLAWDLDANSSSTFAMATSDPITETLSLDLVTPSGIITPGRLVELDAGLLRGAMQGLESAMVWQNVGTNTISWGRFPAGLGDPQTEVLSLAGHGPDVVATPDGYALGWATAAGVEFIMKDVTGATLCGPTLVPFGDGQVGSDEVSMADAEDHTLLLISDSGGNQLGLLRFGRDCQLLDQTLVDNAGGAPRHPRIAQGGGSIALAWDALTDASTIRTHTRRLGEHRCD